MGKRTLVLVIALGLAAVSAFAVWRYLSTVEGDVRADIQEVRVWRATELIETGTEGSAARDVIKESTELAEAVAFEGSTILCAGPVERDSNDVDPAVCDANPRDLDALLDGSVAAGPISAGQVITADMFVTPAELNSISLSESIAERKVAIAIRPEDVSAVGGFIRPGDRVNLLASADIDLGSSIALLKDPDLRGLLIEAATAAQTTTTTPAEGDATATTEDPITRLAEAFPAQIKFTQTILQDLEVLAVGADTRPSPLGTGLEPQGSQVIVLEVTPEQAEKIEYARQYTSIALSLLPSEVPYEEFEARGILVDDIFTLIDRIKEQFEQAGAVLGDSNG
jgi:Flp pilus assembly protein CpaB